MKNGVIWQDVNGNDIHAHAGCIMQFGDTFYWYGEDRSGAFGGFPDWFFGRGFGG